MPRYEIEVEFDDDGPSMACDSCKTIRRAEIMEIKAKDKASVPQELKTYFHEHRYYCTIRRIGEVKEVHHADRS
jgi:1,2-phenylacetyl-CoA epoxidase PaaB subunit